MALVNRDGGVAGFMAWIPAAQDGSDWRPHYDQVEGKPVYDPKSRSYYWTQTIFFMLPEAIR
ncbi:MAG: hypothetical protein KM310_08510 [Clostridiales bacterium]|nr:hypothetical protein [Clostridiales bacterium]